VVLTKAMFIMSIPSVATSRATMQTSRSQRKTGSTGTVCDHARCVAVMMMSDLKKQLVFITYFLCVLFCGIVIGMSTGAELNAMDPPTLRHLSMGIFYDAVPVTSRFVNLHQALTRAAIGLFAAFAVLAGPTLIQMFSRSPPDHQR